MIDIKPIRTETDYEEALQEIDRLWGAEIGTPDGDKLDILLTLVEAYEETHYPIPAPDPIEAILHHMKVRVCRGMTWSLILAHGRVFPRY